MDGAPKTKKGQHHAAPNESRLKSKPLKMAGPPRLELATSGVTGRRSTQLNYDPAS